MVQRGHFSLVLTIRRQSSLIPSLRVIRLTVRLPGLIPGNSGLTLYA
ncbi:hypothetical protein ACIPDS_02860 [Kluyvera sp. NPDC087067]